MTEEKFLQELDIRIAGNPFHPDRTNYEAGDLLEARISDEAFSKFGGFYVLMTPLAQYVPDYEAIPRRNGEVVDLGNIPTLAYSGVQRVTLQLDADTLYDLWYIHHSYKFDPARITTGKSPIPQRRTFDEVQLMLILNSGFKPEDVVGVNATVVHDGVHLRNSSEYLYYGLQVGKVAANISTQNIWVMFYTQRTWNIQTDILARPNSNTMAAEIRKLKAN